MPNLQELIQNTLNQWTGYLGWDEETAEDIYGIPKDKIPEYSKTLATVINLHYPNPRFKTH